MKTLRVASVQMQHTPGDKAANLATVERHITAAAEQVMRRITLGLPQECPQLAWISIRQRIVPDRLDARQVAIGLVLLRDESEHARLRRAR